MLGINFKPIIGAANGLHVDNGIVKLGGEVVELVQFTGDSQTIEFAVYQLVFKNCLIVSYDAGDDPHVVLTPTTISTDDTDNEWQLGSNQSTIAYPNTSVSININGLNYLLPAQIL